MAPRRRCRWSGNTIGRSADHCRRRPRRTPPLSRQRHSRFVAGRKSPGERSRDRNAHPAGPGSGRRWPAPSASRRLRCQRSGRGCCWRPRKWWRIILRRYGARAPGGARAEVHRQPLRSVGLPGQGLQGYSCSCSRCRWNPSAECRRLSRSSCRSERPGIGDVNRLVIRAEGKITRLAPASIKERL